MIYYLRDPDMKSFGVTVRALAGVLFALLVSGCDAPHGEGYLASDIPIPDTLEVWRATIDLTFGGNDSEGPGMIEPVPLGSNSTGDVLILDGRLLEVQRYDSTGRYQGLLVRPGQGPGEMRSRPFSFGSDDRGLWYVEPPAGRVHWVSLDGGTRRVEDTGFGFEALGALRVMIAPMGDGESKRYFVQTLRANPTDRSLRPTLRAGLYVSDEQELVPRHEFDMEGGVVSLDNGRTSFRFPGPLYHPIAFYDEATNEVILLERPVEPAGTLVIQSINDRGVVTSKRRLRVNTPEIPVDRRVRIKERILALASLGGARRVDRDLRDALEQIVDELPNEFPVFDEAVRGPEGTLWLRRVGLDLDGDREWLVLDASFNPLAKALIPVSASEVAFRSDGYWWAVMDAWINEPYVVRLSFTAPAP